jgi:hypothetical protein
LHAEPDARKRRDAERKRDLARHRLKKMYSEAQRRKELDQLDPAVRSFCELQKDRDRRRPRRRGEAKDFGNLGGRPKDWIGIVGY